MDLKQIISIQREFDSVHGWSLKSNETRDLLAIINKDLIGLFGEVGEFSNIIKKINLHCDVADDIALRDHFEKANNDLAEEVVDIFIYLVRIAGHLKIDLADAYLKKLNINKERYKKYETEHKE